MVTKPVVSIVIVNFNSAAVLKDCLASIRESKYSFPFEVYVIDNASDDDLSGLCSEYESVHFVFNKKNLGFAAANNVGIAEAKGDYILLLNPDTIVNSSSFDPMIAYLNSHPHVGIVGCKIFNARGDVEHSTHSFPTLGKEFVHANEALKRILGYDSWLMKLLKRFIRLRSLESYWAHDSEREVDHVTGACMLVRREAIQAAGMLDEAFFLYNEEVEWSYRIRQAGYSSVFLPDSSIIHLFAHSTQQRVQRQVVNRLLVERYRGMFYFFQKHYGSPKLLALRLIVLEGFALRFLFSYINRLNPLKPGRVSTQQLKDIGQIIGLALASNFDWREEL